MVDLKKGGTYLGTFLAPEASIRIEADARLSGALYGKKLDISQKVQISGQPAIDLLARTFVNPNLPK